MGKLQVLFVALILLIALDNCVVRANFYDDMSFNWGFQNTAIWGDGDNLALMLTNVSGSGIQTNQDYLFGSIEMHIKLVEGNSAGTATTYYMSSTSNPTVDDKHDEIDFEFLGNVSGQPYIIHTNVFAHGIGNREQQFYPWFDPTADFHNYTIHWNPSQIVWFVDDIPIRYFKNYESIGIAYPNQQPMRAYSSIWNADSWATQGGRVKIDWNCEPFIARYRQVSLRACKWYGQSSIYECGANSPDNWWTSPEYSQLSYSQMGQTMWVRNNYMIYDYCKDTERFNGQFPLECYLQPF